MNQRRTKHSSNEKHINLPENYVKFSWTMFSPLLIDELVKAVRILKSFIKRTKMELDEILFENKGRFDKLE